MRTIRLIYKLLFLLLSFGSLNDLAAQTSVADGIRREVSQLMEMETAIDFEVTPGFIVGILDGPNEIMLSFGTRDKTTTDTLNARDMFGIGSATKVFTSALLALMQANGVIDLNERYNDLIPEEFRNDQLEALTLRDLLIHQSGLPRDPRTNSSLANPIRSYASLTAEDLLTEYSTSPGPAYAVYSNFGYALIEPALFYTQSKTYDQLLEEYITTPLGLNNTGNRELDSLTTGYNLEGDTVAPVDFGLFACSGGLMTSMTDLMTFARYCLTRAPALLWVDHGPGIGDKLRMSLGWHIVRFRKSTNYIHTGHTLGHSTFVGLNLQTNTAVLILANSAAGTDDLGMEILRIVNDNWKRKS